MHTQLGDPAVNCPDACRGAQHRAHSTAAPAVVSNLENLKLGILLTGSYIDIDAPLKDSGRDGIGGHVSVGIGRDSRTDVEARRMVLKISIEEVRIYGVDDIAGDQKRIGVGA